MQNVLIEKDTKSGEKQLNTSTKADTTAAAILSSSLPSISLSSVSIFFASWFVRSLSLPSLPETKSNDINVFIKLLRGVQ